MAFSALWADPVEQCGHVGIIVDEDVVVLVDEAFELACLVIAAKLQQGEHGILHDESSQIDFSAWSELA